MLPLNPDSGGLSKTFCVKDHDVEFGIDRVFSVPDLSASNGIDSDSLQYIQEKVHSSQDILEYAVRPLTYR
jgi:hypothetical protein